MKDLIPLSVRKNQEKPRKHDPDLKKMKSTLSLGPWDAPDIEILSSEINAIVALIIEQYSPLSQNDLDSVLTFFQLDGLYLRDETESFFLKLESICGRILSGELVSYKADMTQVSEFADYLMQGMSEGNVTQGVKIAAQRFLDFLAENPEYWPLHQGSTKE